jgi:hypothetical protein
VFEVVRESVLKVVGVMVKLDQLTTDVAVFQMKEVLLNMTTLVI